MVFHKRISRSSRDNNKKTNYILLNCFLIVAVLLTIVVYLVEVNTGISYGLTMKDNEGEFQKLSIENKRLLKNITELGSMANIYITSRDLHMTKVQGIDYLISTEETFAEK